MTTIKDIAEKAGVAKSTVSRYLNNGYVSEEKRKILDQIIAETGYRPNTFARSLKAQDTKLLGVIIPRLNSPSTNDVLKGIDQAAREHGYQLLITNSDQNDERELENIDMLVKQKVAGIILFARNSTEKLKEVLADVSIPVLLLGQQVDGFHSIVHEDYQAGKTMAEYATNLGHRRFLFVGVSEQDQAVGVLRKKGFFDGLKQTSDVEVDFIETTFSRKETYERALEFLKNQSATYIACATDYIAIAVLKAAHELGLQVPKDFSLNGFGGYDATDYIYPTITTTQYPFEQVGIDAVMTVQQLMKGEEIPAVIALPNHLVVKQSTAPLPQQDSESSIQ